jgi:hypothetical protein
MGRGGGGVRGPKCEGANAALRRLGNRGGDVDEMALLCRNVQVRESEGDTECTDGYKNLLGVYTSVFGGQLRVGGG